MAIDSRAETLALQGIVIEDSTITGAQSYAVRYEMGDTVMLRRVTSAGSGGAGDLLFQGWPSTRASSSQSRMNCLS